MWGLAARAAAWPIVARAQQGDRMRRIGVLMTGDENDPRRSLASLRSRKRSRTWRHAEHSPRDAIVGLQLERFTVIGNGAIEAVCEMSYNRHRSR